MPEIKPLRAIRYNSKVVQDLSAVVTPPYDVIDADAQEKFYARHPNNFVRIDLARELAGDTPADSRYTRARHDWNAWLESGVLQQDEQPAIYLYEQLWALPSGAKVLRRGFLCLTRIHDYAEKVILPHERTLTGPKRDRLELMRETEAQLSQIFLLYDDPELAIDAALIGARGATPEMDVVTEDGIHHQVWLVTNPAVISFVSEKLRNQAVLIADGHHRYETALAYRNERRTAESVPGAATEYALAYFTNSADPGLVVWPTHRVLYGLQNFDPKSWLSAVASIFDVRPIAEQKVEELEALLAESSRSTPSFIVLTHGATGVDRHLLALNQDRAAAKLSEISGPAACRELDLAILHEIVLPQLTGVSLEAQAAKTNIHYIKGAENALREIDSPDNQVVVLTNPIPVSTVRRICEEGGFMPQKSTFFYPKVLSGLVAYSVAQKHL